MGASELSKSRNFSIIQPERVRYDFFSAFVITVYIFRRSQGRVKIRVSP